MSQNAIIKNLGTTPEVFDSYLKKASEFAAGLTPAEAAIQTKLQPPAKPAKILSPEVTQADLTQLVGEHSPVLGVFFSNVWP